MKPGSQTLLFGVLLGFVVVACAISGPIGSRYGRRVGLALCAITSIIGPVIQIVAPNIGVVTFGRAISGAGIGFAANFCIMYWAETTPAHLRGVIVSVDHGSSFLSRANICRRMMYQGFINLAQFVGSCVNYGTHNITTKMAWRGPLLVMIVAPLILLICLPFIPDTPSEYTSPVSFNADTARMVCPQRAPRRSQQRHAQDPRPDMAGRRRDPRDARRHRHGPD